MTKLFATGALGFVLLLSSPLGAAGAKKAAPAKKAKTQKAKAKKPAATRYAQQEPTKDRYTEIQQALVDRGYLAEADGNWGAASVAALKKFQSDQRLNSDGKLGSLSLRALGLGPRHTDSLEEAITAGILPAGSAPTPLD